MLNLCLFEMEVIICIKVDLALNNLHGFIRHNPNPTKNNQTNRKNSSGTILLIAGEIRGFRPW